MASDQSSAVALPLDDQISISSNLQNIGEYATSDYGSHETEVAQDVADPQQSEAQIHRLKLRVENLRARTSTPLDDTFPATSFRRIPENIWAEIFMLSTDGTAEDFYLAQVCSSWRRIALALPRMWSKSSISLSESLNKWKYNLTRHLVRSKTMPFQLCINLPTFPGRLTSLRQQIEYGALITQHRGQVEALKTSVEWIVFETRAVLRHLEIRRFCLGWYTVIQPFRDYLKPLESLKIRDDGTERLDDFTYALELFVQSPSLRNLDLCFISTVSESWSPYYLDGCQWKSLQTLRLSHTDINLVITFLDKCPEMRAFTLDCSSLQLARTSSAMRLPVNERCVSCVETFILHRIGHKSTSFLSALFDRLTFKRLSFLKLEGDPTLADSQSFPSATLVGCLQCSVMSISSLHTFSCRNVSIDEKDLLDLLKLMPFLRTLGLFTKKLSERFYRKMSFTGEFYKPSFLLQNLCNIEMSVDEGLEKAFLDMVQSRLLPEKRAHLNYVGIRWSPKHLDALDIAQRLTTLREAGISVDVDYTCVSQLGCGDRFLPSNSG